MWLDSLPGASQGRNRGVAQAGLLFGGSVEESACRFAQVGQEFSSIHLQDTIP